MSAHCPPNPAVWGSWAIPPNPRGWYRPIAQMYDAKGLTRVYPSAVSECAGIVAKKDLFWPREVYSILNYIDGTAGLWADHINFQIPYYLSTFGAELSALVGFPGVYDWGFWQFWDTTATPNKWVAVLTKWVGEGSDPKVIRLHDLTTWSHNASPWSGGGWPTAWVSIGGLHRPSSFLNPI